MENNILDTTCIMCPMGCNLHIEKKADGTISVTGNTCERGKIYGTSEITQPVRTLTTLVKYKNRVISVKTDKPIPKSKIKDAMKEIEFLRPSTARFGQTLIKNIAGTDANLIVTRM